MRNAMESIQQCRGALQSDDVAERAAAAEQLCHAGTDAAPATLELVRACGDDETVRDWAVAALEELGPPPKELVEPLGKLAADNDVTVAYWAVTLLGRLGPDAVGSEQQVAAVLERSPDDAVRERAAWALGEMKAKSAGTIAALENASNASSPRLARLAQSALKQVQK